MTKKEYQRPTIEVSEAYTEEQILAGSITGITTSGLDEEELELPGDGQPKSGSIWDFAL